ncbi:RHS repeat-associated core domain-containing protein [Kitasatospora viridis]|uniref:RHS repeat-associated protein n=1 Tax=Kitasatospora viridis TaxID=281105 RepID=A0A561TSA6_9ACTN|nr:RHS repeat-associated core domain-containing protein [Kitasatospora viridis]TWF89996.1 RHS repeat-associated protein [Kitasatospora viridis]
MTVALATVAALAMGSAPPSAAAATAAKPHAPAVPQIKRAATRPLVPTAPAAPKKMPVGARKGSSWPAAASADVSLAGAGTGQQAHAAGTPVAALPVTLHGAATGRAAAPNASTAPAGVHVQVLDQKAAAAAGVTGVLFTLTPQPGAGGARTTASVDYSSFADAAGAGFGTRLRLVELPACALTTPQLTACQMQTPVAGSRNDAKAQTVSADLTLPAAGTGDHAASPATGAAASAMVLAATAGSSGTNGDFTATSLKPSGSWSAGGASGAFTWSYPIAVPPVAAGGAPSVALSYDSALVDGATATTNNQPSWVGEGWDYAPGYIERTYETCSTFTDLPAASQTGDNCWAGQILTMSLNGQSNALVWDQSTGQLKLQSDDGSRVERLTDTSNGALGNEYFKVTTPDGTQYFFGREHGEGWTDQATTNSVFTEPVYGAHPGDPCYSSAGFASSECTQAWRWNLDEVEDVHGNVQMYYYSPETGYYGQNGSTTGTAYTRGGYLSRIDYGLRDENGTVYGATAPDQITFSTSQRCTPGTPAGNTCADSQFTSANATYWPDVPMDQDCASGATCNVHSPTFWLRQMLTNITTQYWNGSKYVRVDSYDLGHQFPTDGDPALWLSSVTRTGFAADGSSIALPATTFAGQLLANRVPGYQSLPPMLHWRLTTVTSNTGDVTSVTYTTSCASGTIPSDPSTNTTQCMPVYWTPPGYSAPVLDWFDTYVVSQVTEGGSKQLTPPKVTSYSYVGGAAWHFDDNEVVKPANRTYGQFRGYGEVDVKTGDPTNGEKPTRAATFYYRGMNGDVLPGGATRTATVTDTLGETTTDDYRLIDQPYETQVFDGDGGAELSATLTDYTVVATTATRPRTGLPALTADLVRPAKSRALTDLAAGGVRTTSTADAYDGTGRLVSTDATGDGVPELCTTNTYADNAALGIHTRVAEAIESQQACPPAGTAQSNVLADTRNYYDGSSTLGQLPGPGEVTRTDVLNDTNGAAPAFFTKSTTAYDASGRLLSTKDALGRTASTAYTPADGGPLTKVVSTNPLNQTSTTIQNPDRGTVVSSTDIAGHVTSATYDALGRLTQLWKPGRAQGTNTPSATYSYLLQSNGPEVTTANTLVDYGTGTAYVTATTLTDALGRTVQTQTATEGGGSQVSDTFYDGHGWTVATNDHYLITAAPSTTVQTVAVNAVDGRTVNSFDGSGRVTSATTFRDGLPTGTTRTVYGGDRTTTVPPTGGTTATTITDARGRTTELDQYTANPTVTGDVVSGGSIQPTTYQYDALGHQTQLKSAGSTWSNTYDLLGNKLSATDPDTGVSTTRYDLDNEAVSATDARKQTLAYSYDALGRKTAEYSGSTSGTELASWVWDTLQPGQPTSETEYTSAGDYTSGASGYDGIGDATGEYLTLPFQETGLKGTWTTSYGYSSTGLLLTTTPAPVGTMPAETVTTSYDHLGQPVAVVGTSITASQVLNGYALPGQITYGGSTNNAWESFTYDVQTLRPDDVNLDTQTAAAQADDTKYTYDPSGQITRIDDTQGPNGVGAVDDQCFGYDALQRLTQAWTATDACAADPASAGNATVGGGPAPYWTNWTFNPDGGRATQTQHALPGSGAGDVTTTYSYTPSGQNGGHSLCATSTTGPAPTSPCTYGYDAAGNTTSRPDVSGSTNQTLTWDAGGRLAKDSAAAGTTSYVDNADGNEIVRHDPGSTTLYLPGQEVTRTANGTVSATRYYTLGGTLVGESTGQAGSTDYEFGDQHGTQQIAVNTTTLAVTRRAFDPYGNERGKTAGGTWPDNHGFIGKPDSAATGLMDIGARKYDPVTGRFVSVDPVLETGDPQELNGYAYSAADPVNGSDPSGMSMLCAASGECGSLQAIEQEQQNEQAAQQNNEQTVENTVITNGCDDSTRCMEAQARAFKDPSYAAQVTEQYDVANVVLQQREAQAEADREAEAARAAQQASCSGWFCSAVNFVTHAAPLLDTLALVTTPFPVLDVVIIGLAVTADVVSGSASIANATHDSGWNEVFDIAGAVGSFAGVGITGVGFRTAKAAEQAGGEFLSDMAKAGKTGASTIPKRARDSYEAFKAAVAKDDSTIRAGVRMTGVGDYGMYITQTLCGNSCGGTSPFGY